MVLGLDPGVSHASGRGRKAHSQYDVRADLDRPHPDRLAVTLKCMTIADEEVRAGLFDPQHHGASGRHLLNIEITAVRAVIDGQDSAMDRGDADYARHRLHRQLEPLVPDHVTVVDVDDLGPDSPFLAAYPVREHAVPRPERAVAASVKLDIEDLDLEHVTGFRSCDLDRTSRAVYKREGHIGLG